MAIVKLPQQKKSFKAKNKKWREETVDAIDSAVSYFNSVDVRMAMEEKHINSKLYDGELTMSDVLKTVSSAGVLNAYVPDKVQHRPIIRPKIELLLGEIAKDPFSWSVMVTDPTSISRKKESKKELLNKLINELLEEEYSEEELAKKLKEVDLEMKYTWKDMKEVRATKILKYFTQKLHLDRKFNECALDKFIHGEEIMFFDIVGNTVEAFKLDPKHTYIINNTNSNDIADADGIVIEEYWNVGKVIDTYYDWLTPAEIDELNAPASLDNDDSSANRVDTTLVEEGGILMETTMANVSTYTNFNINGSSVDANGNVRVLRVLWRSQKLVKIVSGTDPETGDPYEKVMSEEYIPNPLLNETVKKVWVGEWWEGTKIKNKLYKKIQPRPVQFTTAGNISKGHPGVVGKFNSVSGGKVVSFLSKMKPYQYLYDIVWDRLLDALKKDMGSIMEMDFAKKPKDFTTKKWLHYAYKGGILFVDSFKEALKGAATGKLAGTFNSTGRQISSSDAAYINQHINLLEYIKKEMGEVVGITPQREGAVGSSATVGGTERSVMQSNSNTYYEFYTHQNFKIDCLNVLLETAKIALRENKELAQNILDDFSIEMFDIDGDDFMDSDYSVFLTVSKNSKDLHMKLEAYAQAFMQNGGSFGTVLDVLFSDSIAEKRRKIELADAEIKEQQQAQAEAQSKAAQEALQAQQQKDQQEFDLKKYEIDQNNITKIAIKEMDIYGVEHKSSVDEVMQEKDHVIKEKEMKSRERIAKEKSSSSGIKKE